MVEVATQIWALTLTHVKTEDGVIEPSSIEDGDSYLRFATAVRPRAVVRKEA